MKRTTISWYFVSFQWRCCWKKVPENRCHSTAQNPRPLFATFFCSKISQLLSPLSPLLPAELKSIILVLPRARVRYLCGMVGKRKWGTRGWVHFVLEKVCLKRCSLNAALSTSPSSHILKCSSRKFQLFRSKTRRSKLQEEPIQENPTFFVTNSFSPFAIFREESFSLKSITWAVWPWALSDKSGPVKMPMF